MSFKDIINILYETMRKEINRLGKDIQLEVSIDENFYTLKHYYLMSIFRNLIMNSIDAILTTKENGKISVIHKAHTEEHIFIVSDNGVGIDEEGLKRIFFPPRIFN